MTRLWAACIIAVAACVSPAHAQGFPSKTIRIIVPFTPGGSNDVVAREIATGLQARLNQTAIVENKPGGGGTIAYSFVAKSPPDGHTLLIAPASFTMGPHLSRNPVYNPVTDFAAINLVADVPFAMVVPASLPVRTVKEFVELAKKSPSKLSFGSVGVGTPPDIIATLNREIAAIIADPGFQQRMTAIGVDVVGTTPAAYAKMLRDDYEKWSKVIAAAGIKPE